MRSDRTFKVLAHKVLRILVALGAVRVVHLSSKGRISQFVERIEPAIRTKLVRYKWFPPVILALNPVETPNSAVTAYFSSRVVFIHAESTRRITTALGQVADGVPDKPIRVIRKIKRPGDPWLLRPSIGTRKSWAAETDELLERMGIARGTPVVLLAIRDESYYEKARANHALEPGSEVQTNTYIRNPDPATYGTAILRLNQLGYIVTSFGSKAVSWPTDVSSGFVDYATGFRTARGDLLMARYCTMMMNGATGASLLAGMFNRPVAFSNSYVPFMAGFGANRFIPQLMWSEREQRLLSFLEMAKSGWTYTYLENCQRDGIVLVKNTADDIADHAIECLERTQGVFLETTMDHDLQSRFRHIQQLSPPPVDRHIPIGTLFLRKYQHLLN